MSFLLLFLQNTRQVIRLLHINLGGVLAALGLGLAYLTGNFLPSREMDSISHKLIAGLLS
jgi:hypothetical protein